jgi:hypothetical protein
MDDGALLLIYKTARAQAPTSLDGWIGLENEPIRKCSNVLNDFAFPRMQGTHISQSQ